MFLERRDFPGARILIVDDNVALARVTQFALTRAGFQTSIAGNGRLALSLVTAETFDIIITDQQMPEMTGLELIKQVGLQNYLTLFNPDSLHFERYWTTVWNTILFVIKPRGWRTPLTDDMLPQFYYIHKPHGSPPGPRSPSPRALRPLVPDPDVRRSTEVRRGSSIRRARRS